ncbi:hypothetical protein [uncultured Muribaculum sp.]|uniref:hypothetical protein n=1 Tax=uncultured Muribaculum sp. TaxID=1918613 RepID=UPI0025878864|nr:hypothetical protein [uncultured Muribaculum sp.]
MYGQKFEYFLNAVHYCMWLFERKSQDIINRTFLLIISPIPKYLLSRKYKERFYRYQKQRMTELDKFFNDKKSGYNIGWANHWFGFFYSSYTGIIILSLLGLILRKFGDINTIIFILIIVIPITLWYIPAYKAVFTKDRYLQYFRQFEKENKYWHKRWKRKTTAFIVGGIVANILGIIVAFSIAMN